jgi:hypothetical protein
MASNLNLSKRKVENHEILAEETTSGLCIAVDRSKNGKRGTEIYCMPERWLPILGCFKEMAPPRQHPIKMAGT